MTFSIITPSYDQLDWLRLCVASVRDQFESGLKGGMEESSAIRSSTEDRPSLPECSLEHIIQDAGTSGIDDFAREIGANFYRDGSLVFKSSHEAGGEDPAGSSRSYQISIFCEQDEGMYDAINRGFLRASGEIRAYLNCDEQYLPGTLEYVNRWFARNPLKEILFGDAIVVDSQGGYLCDRRVMPPTDWHTRVSGNLSFFTAATFFRAALTTEQQILFSPEWKALGDAAWALELLRHQVRMGTSRKPLSAHADTGKNLILSPVAKMETLRLHATAPRLARIFKPALLAIYRLKRLLAGAYFLQRHRYSIYTHDLPTARKDFEVVQPTHLWANRSGET